MANAYDSWTGLSEIAKSALFETATRKPVDPSEEFVGELWDYLPKSPQQGTAHYFIARIATTNALKEDCVELFGSGSWDEEIRKQLAAVHFTKIGDDFGDLQSNVDATIRAEHWRSEGRILVTRNLNPPGIPTAKIVFRRTTDDFRVSAFWCWA